MICGSCFAWPVVDEPRDLWGSKLGETCVLNSLKEERGCSPAAVPPSAWLALHSSNCAMHPASMPGCRWQLCTLLVPPWLSAAPQGGPGAALPARACPVSTCTASEAAATARHAAVQSSRRCAWGTGKLGRPAKLWACPAAAPAAPASVEWRWGPPAASPRRASRPPAP